VRHHRLPDTFSYNDYWSMVGDIVIIAKTLRAVFQRDGAY
jgi:lipopolysaccharide/colanic/teichoic acid biosynthesis glycosyltransferase